MRTDLRPFPAAQAAHALQATQHLTPPKQQGQEDEATRHLQQLAQLPVPAVYPPALQRWQDTLTTLGAVHFTATTRGPLALGLGNPSPYEVGLTLHHTYGVPYLPGSALKGLTLRAARKNNVPDDIIAAIFGEQNPGRPAYAGHVIFWDGWLQNTTGPFLQLDTITVHHPQYYQGGKAWPTDFDDPTPVAFLSVKSGLNFQVALSGPKDLAKYAAGLLEWGLRHLGLGGKTNAGYGTLHRTSDLFIPLSEQEQQAAAAARASAEAENFVTRLQTELKNGRAVRDNGVRLLDQIRELSSPHKEKAVAGFVERANRFGEKDWAKKARKLLEEA